MRKCISIVLFLSALSVFAEEECILATTTWTASFVQASAPNLKVVTLASADLRHPPEYELRPSDAVLLNRCVYFVYAGYETLIPKVKQGSLKVKGRQIQIQTVNTPQIIRQSVILLAREWGTEPEAEKNVREIEQFYKDWKQDIAQRGFAGAPILCNAFLEPIARELGFQVVGTYGTTPLEAARIAALSSMNPRFILDNWHTDAGKPLIKALPDTPVVSFINFPGKDGTETLLDVLSYNRKELSRLFK
ncbi:MAG TPA: hypothetical protein PLG79_15240 [Spirochaetales bacterium]|nr:hypothetical protein [Spirochaetales bacterium]